MRFCVAALIALASLAAAAADAPHDAPPAQERCPQKGNSSLTTITVRPTGRFAACSQYNRMYFCLHDKSLD
ncbi:jg24170 [Pararge aegeria aegeria]|uniref:Jg24170 protein n=1 Tax=Pararge aegeria aegeria TaxID=348720 RepID=A0A8S4S8X8_9NEOP|nr:jg24170 [Pararge aegeria aegeria]